MYCARPFVRRLRSHMVSLLWGVLPVMDYTGSEKAEANTTKNGFKLVYYISAGQTSLLQE